MEYFDKDLNVSLAHFTPKGWLIFNKCAVEEFNLESNENYSLNCENNRLYFSFSIEPISNSKRYAVKEDGQAYFIFKEFLTFLNIKFEKNTYFRIEVNGHGSCFINLSFPVTEQTMDDIIEEELLVDEMLGPFELFDKKNMTSSSYYGVPSVSVKKEGRFSFNSATVKKHDLIKNKYVKLYYDPTHKKIGFKFTHDDKEKGVRRLIIPVKSRPDYGSIVNCIPFFRKYDYFGIIETKNYSLELDEKLNILFIKL